MSYLVIDLETGTREAHGRKGNPWYNEIVALGLKPENTPAIAQMTRDLKSQNTLKSWINGSLSSATILVGHNIKFDLLYLWEESTLQDFFRAGGKIWDTQLAEYLLTGQQAKYSALRDLAVNKYSCASREKKMENYWKQGIDTKDIPEDLVKEDVLFDVLDTEKIYKHQLELAKQGNIFNFIEDQMDGLLATIEIEYNGFKVDRDVLHKNKERLRREIIDIENQILSQVNKLWTSNIPFNPNSNDHTSIILFGGELKESVDLPLTDESGQPILFKTGQKIGQIKTKKIEKSFKINGLGIPPQSDWKAAKAGFFSTKEEVLQTIAELYPSILLPKLLIANRELHKQLGTYYEGIETNIYGDGCIRASYNHVSTNTGRLSSSNPNMQNVPKAEVSKVKEHFVSRFEDGYIISADYSQLEIAIQAQMSGDNNYITDVKNKVDFHIKRLALQKRIPYETAYKKIKEDKDQTWINQRTKVKAFSFARAYGAGVTKICAQSGLEEDEVRTIIEEEEKEYAQLTAYNRWLKEVVERNGYYKDPWGRRYCFTKYPNKFKWQKGTESYSPTEIVNYRTQGFATATINIIMLGVFWRKAIHHRDKFLIINTVHDSTMLDCKGEYRTFAKKLLKDILTSVPKYSKMRYGYEFRLDLEVDVKEGKSWLEV